MQTHQLLEHPLFEETRIDQVLEPFGFEVHTEILDLPCPHEDPVGFEAFEKTPSAYLDGLEFDILQGFTEIARFDTEDSEIVLVAVRAKTAFAQLLLCADSSFAGPSSNTSRSYIDVYKERMRQLSTEGFSRERDDGYRDGDIAIAACCYAEMAACQSLDRKFAEASYGPGHEHWPWDKNWWKPSDPRRNLVKAGALILAEIERLDRADTKLSGGEIPVGASDVGGAA
ncbi:hypothetical protein SAMN05216571_101226 [Onishia taeanensis]|uniref:Uncharacterized protein n=1 Tax=Onishia taeanensis TaxID=284577 RepID=A0A1G7N6P3_9GAMM|nr:hypothetical protein [Halomonas taeanensis]SDF68990.1 hypothetical protein SAMN05216571_101226 [Halomonas taeanensis]